MFVQCLKIINPPKLLLFDGMIILAWNQNFFICSTTVDYLLNSFVLVINQGL